MNDAMRSGNPVLAQGLNSAPALGQWSGAATMSVSGTALKTLILLGLVLLTGGYSFFQTLDALRGSGGDIGETLQRVSMLAMVGMVGGLVTCLAMFFVPSWSPVAAPVYALCKGLALGLISGLAEARFQGIVAQAVLLSLAVLGLMLFLYTNGTLRATPALTKGIPSSRRSMPSVGPVATSVKPSKGSPCSPWWAWSVDWSPASPCSLFPVGHPSRHPFTLFARDWHLA